MNKAILIMDKPACCGECRLNKTSYLRVTPVCFCIYEDHMVDPDELLSFPEWCPLKPLPQRQNKDEEKSSLEYVYEAPTLDEFQSRGASYLYGHIDGWNACLKEIEK